MFWSEMSTMLDYDNDFERQKDNNDKRKRWVKLTNSSGGKGRGRGGKRGDEEGFEHHCEGEGGKKNSY
jgi:hypothetical protein